MSSTTGKRGGQGSHGSITKAGKVRGSTPKCDVLPRKITKQIKKGNELIGTETVIRHHRKKHGGPKMANRRLSHLRMPQEEGGLGREAGQWRKPI